MDNQLSERQMNQDSFSQLLFFPELKPDEALLLCQVSKYQWMTWIPEYGEYLLTL